MSKPHILAFTYPAQGHILPLMEFSQSLAKHGFRVTFVHTQYIHKPVINSMVNESHIVDDHIHLVSIPDGLEPGEDKNSIHLLTEAIQEFMSHKLEELIEKINKEEGEKISCLIADESCGWAVEVARKMKIVKVVAFLACSSCYFGVEIVYPKVNS